MRVEELADELHKSGREVIEVLKKQNITDRNESSPLSDEEADKVRAVFAARKKRPPERKKKKNIIQVFNPQNSRMSGGPDERLSRERKPRPARDEARRRRPEQGSPEAQQRKQRPPVTEEKAKSSVAVQSETDKVPENSKLSAAVQSTADMQNAAGTVNRAVQEKNHTAETVEKAAKESHAAEPVSTAAAEKAAKDSSVKAEKVNTAADDQTIKESRATDNAPKESQTETEKVAAVANKPEKDSRVTAKTRQKDADRTKQPRQQDDRRQNTDGQKDRKRQDGGRKENARQGDRTSGNSEYRRNNNNRRDDGTARREDARDGQRDRNRTDGGRRQERYRQDGSRTDAQRGDNTRRDNRGDNQDNRRNQDNRGYANRRSDGGRGDGQRTDNGRRDGGRRQDGSRQDGRNGRRERLQMPDRPTEAIERQTQKNERQTQRNDRRDRQNDSRDNFDKKQNKAAVRSLQKHPTKPVKPHPQEPKEEVIKNITLPERLTIRELAEKMKVQPSVIVKKLFMQGTVVTVNQEIDFDTAEEIALEFNCIAEAEEKIDVIAELLKEEEENEEDMEPRVPVVCVMGHVDHGKTSLLDAIRNTRVTDKEAGGITQHIGASVVECNGQKITFLDTPGHEAFTAMRMRGANSTDIAILVVAADDGVMPQTVEAISHAKAAGVEIIVAINKIDKPGANVDKVKQELTEYELIPEDWGGSTICVPVSAHTQEGIESLLEMILLTAEVMELKANPKRQARGLVIEAKLDKGKGPVASVLVQKGTLHVGDFIAAGACHGKVRAMMDDQGRNVKEAGPSMPVEILGFTDVPGAGEIFVAPTSDKEARSFAETFFSQGREKMLEETRQHMSLDDLFNQIQAGNLKELNLIVKADVQGSVEAVRTSLLKLSNDEVVVKVIHGGVGAINESDVVLASASNAIIIGFNVRPDATARVTAEREGVDLRLYKVIYNAIEDVEAAMKGMLDPVFEEKVLGHAEVRQLFKASGVGTIAGAYVLDGTFTRGCNIRIKRGDEQIFDGALASLKRFKDDVKEVRAGFECGLVVEKFNEIQEGDIYEAYTMVEVPR